MFWWTTPLDMGCCPLWMLSLDITRSRWPRKTERLSQYRIGGHVLLQGDAVWSKEYRGDVPASHDCAVSWYDSQGNGGLCRWHDRQVLGLRRRWIWRKCLTDFGNTVFVFIRKRKPGGGLVLCQVSYSGSLSAEEKSKSTCKRQSNYRHAGTKDRERNQGFLGQATIHQQVHCPAHTHLWADL